MIIWLTEDAQDNWDNFTWDPVKTDDSKKKNYLDDGRDIQAIITGVPSFSVPKEFVEKITIREKLTFPAKEGIYRHDDATLVIKRVGAIAFGDNKGCELSIGAPNVDTLMTIYTLVRQNKLAPDDDWGEAG